MFNILIENLSMKKLILKTFAIFALASGVVSCGNDFLETNYYKGIDTDTGLGSVANIGTALNGTYYRLFHYAFAGNYAITIGDVASDLSYWNNETGHWDDIYTFKYTDTDNYLSAIWNYGYKVIDNSSRVIKAGKAIIGSVSEADKVVLNVYMAEAYAMRGYAALMLTNIFGHQIKVNGTDYSDKPGIVVVDEPVKPYTNVSRSTVGKSYEAIIDDFNAALQHFTDAGTDRGSLQYFNVAATYGLMARAQLYMEDWENAATNAQNALTAANITTLAYTADAYAALYASETSNNESMFALAITASNNWSANSCGTLWSTYNFSPSPKLQAIYGANDCRKSIMSFASTSTAQVPVYNSGKFAHPSSGNPAYATNYIVNAPEMFLIIAEAKANVGTDLDGAKEALLTVAKRNADIKTVADLPSSKEDVLAFIKDERARELFQEGFRLYDLRRWDVKADLFATSAPAVTFTYTNFDIANLVFPIPSDEINAGFGVEQNDGYADTMPKKAE